MTQIRFDNDSINDLINDSKKVEVGKVEESILKVIGTEQRYSKSEIASKIGKSPATVQRGIRSLIEKGLIKRVGSNKTGYWLLL